MILLFLLGFTYISNWGIKKSGIHQQTDHYLQQSHCMLGIMSRQFIEVEKMFLNVYSFK